MSLFLHNDTQSFAEALIMDYLTLTKELDDVVDVGIVGEPKNVVVSDTSLLLCCNCKSASFCAAEQRNKSLRDL